MGAIQSRYINIHGHRQADNIEEWVMQNLMARDFPPDDIENGYYSVGFHPYNVGKADEQETLKLIKQHAENDFMKLVEHKKGMVLLEYKHISKTTGKKATKYFVFKNDKLVVEMDEKNKGTLTAFFDVY